MEEVEKESWDGGWGGGQVMERGVNTVQRRVVCWWMEMSCGLWSISSQLVSNQHLKIVFFYCKGPENNSFSISLLL